MPGERSAIDPNDSTDPTDPRQLIVWMGWDPREQMAWHVAAQSLHVVSPRVIPRRLSLSDLQERGLYTRPIERRGVDFWDPISVAPMSTEHAISRFLVPYLCEYRGWALFVDGDVLFRRPIEDLFALADPQYAVMCVQHPPLGSAAPKKLGQTQTLYSRKNWSSVMLFNCEHRANQRLTLDLVNKLAGRDLHAFCWLDDHHIGMLPAKWNYLVNVTAPHLDPDPNIIALVHFTLGVPALAGHESDPFAEEWFAAARAAGYTQP